MSPADVAVVVVTHNSEHVIDDLLDSLPPALGGLRADVVVVDNASSDGTVDRLRRRGDARVVRAENLGYSAGINRGVREASPAPVILVLNPDVRMHALSIPPMVARLGVREVGIVAPKIFNPDGTLHTSLRREPTPLRALGLNRTGWPMFSEYVTDPDSYAAAGPVDWALGAVLAMSRTCFDAVGGWDESYFLYSEETDLCLKARDLGYRMIYEPAGEATHIGGQSGQSDVIHTMQIINRVRLYRRRNGAGPAAWLYFALTVLSELSWIARGHPQSRLAVRSLVRPRVRPPQLSAGDSLLPR